MSANTVHERLQVEGLGVAVPDASNGALAGASGWSLLLAVSTADGEPVTGLPASAFSVAAVVFRPRMMNEPVRM